MFSSRYDSQSCMIGLHRIGEYIIRIKEIRLKNKEPNGSTMNQKSVVIIGSTLLVAALIIGTNTKASSMCNDEVFVSNDVYITGCIINPGVVSPGEYIYTVRMAPRNGHVREEGTYYTYLGRTGSKAFDILYRWYAPFKSSPEIEDKRSMQIKKDQPIIELRKASGCTAASIKVIGFKDNQLEHQIIIPERCRDKIKK